MAQISVGNKAPDFTLEGTTGTISLADFTAKGNVVLYFIREFGCHQCMGHAVELGKIQAELSVANTRVIVVGGGSLDAAKKMASRYKLSYPILADPDRKVYDRYGLDKAMLFIQKSGVFVVDRAGTVRYCDVGANPTSNFNRVEILNACQKAEKGG
jgi:peroxiredoxin